MRLGEILGLTWDKVDLKGQLITLEAGDTKDKERRLMPINDDLLYILQEIPRAIHDHHVFLYRGKPIKDIRSGLKGACQKAGIPYGQKVNGGFIFHDLRHTFNTNMRKAGVPESVIMKITGHATREMFDRYDTTQWIETISNQLLIGLENISLMLPRMLPQYAGDEFMLPLVLPQA